MTLYNLYFSLKEVGGSPLVKKLLESHVVLGGLREVISCLGLLREGLSGSGFNLTLLVTGAMHRGLVFP